MNQNNRSLLDIIRSYRVPSLTRGDPSTASSTYASDPRKDLAELRNWDLFDSHLKETRSRLMNTRASEGLKMPQGQADVVYCEEDLRFEAKKYIHRPAIDIYSALQSHSKDKMNIRTPIGHNAVLGNPDFIWLLTSSLLPFGHVEYKTFWAFPFLDILRYRSYICENQTTEIAQGETCMKVIKQLYGYMYINNNAYGILSTFNHTFVFHRAEDTADGGVLEIAGPFAFDSYSPHILEVWITMLRLSEENPLHATKIENAMPKNVSLNVRYLNNELGVETYLTKWNEVHLENGIAHSRCGLVIDGKFEGKHCVYKSVDVTKHQDLKTELQNELEIYSRLYQLQNTVIPSCWGIVEYFGLLEFLVLDKFGDDWSPQLVASYGSDALMEFIKDQFRSFHEAGILHGDVKLENIRCAPRSAEESNPIRIIDFGFSKYVGAHEIQGHPDFAQELQAIKNILQQLQELEQRHQ